MSLMPTTRKPPHPIPGKGLTLRIGPQWVDQALLLRAQLSAALGSEVSLTVTLRAAVLLLEGNDVSLGAVVDTAKEILAAPVTRVRVKRDTKKAEPDSAKEQKAQASPKASQSKGILRAPPSRTPATGNSRPPVRPVAPNGPRVDSLGRTMLYAPPASDD